MSQGVGEIFCLPKTAWPPTSNPFSSVTYIPFYLAHTEKITLSIIDIQGREVDVIFNGIKSQGNHVIEYHSGNLSQGIYYCKIKTNTRIVTKMMVKL